MRRLEMKEYIPKIRDKYSNHAENRHSSYIDYLHSSVPTIFVLADFILEKSFEESLGNAMGCK
jgi:hypothetical protein